MEKPAAPEQLQYAKSLRLAVLAGFIFLLVSFALYLSGTLTPLIPVEDLPRYWRLSAAEFVKATGTPTGWHWLAFVGRGDMLNLIGIAILAASSLVSTLAVLPIFARSGDKLQIVIALLLVAVVILSASNVFAAAN